jgi:hypothetical protein
MFSNNLPPRTPQKVARLVSGLSIPRGAKVIEYNEQWNDFNGNGYSLIVLKIEEKSFEKIFQEAKLLNFKMLPITEDIYEPFNELANEIRNGVYKIDIDKEGSMSFSGTIINYDNYSIIVYVDVN